MINVYNLAAIFICIATLVLIWHFCLRIRPERYTNKPQCGHQLKRETIINPYFPLSSTQECLNNLYSDPVGKSPSTPDHVRPE